MAFVYDGLAGVFLSNWPFNAIFVLGLVFLLITVLISIFSSFGSIGGHSSLKFRFRGGSGIKGPDLVHRAGSFGFHPRRARRGRRIKKKIGTQVNYITNVYSDGEKIESNVSSHDKE